MENSKLMFMEEKREEKKEENKENKEDKEVKEDIKVTTRKINYHLIIITIIVIIFIFGIFILLRWNKGVDSEFDPDYVTTDFDIEELDFLMFWDPILFEGREDDGEIHILCIGNNPFTDETGANGLAALIAKETGGTTYNAAFPKSKIVCNPNPSESEEYFSLYYVTMALINNDFARINEIADKIKDKRFVRAAETLANVNMEKIDFIVIMYDTTDYNELTAAHNPNDDYDLNAFTGALKISVEYLKQFFPHIKIIFMSHSYAEHLDENGEVQNGIITDLGNGTVTHYLIMGYDVATSTGFTFIDNFFGTIHEENHHEYMIDHMHYNDAGRLLLAKRVAKIILEE